MKVQSYVLYCLIFSVNRSSSATIEHISRNGLSSEKSVVFEYHPAPSTFTKLSSPPPKNHKLDIRIGIKNQLDDNIEELLGKISDPYHPSYRNHLTGAQSDELITPKNDSVDLVETWLKRNGLEQNQLRWSRTKDWVTVKDVTLQKAEEMLNTTYAVYQHQDGDHIIRTEQFSLPQHLHKHIDVVQPTTMFGQLNKHRSTLRVIEKVTPKKLRELNDSNIPQTCSDPYTVSNECLRELYQTSDYKIRSAHKGNRIGVTGFMGEVANKTDLQKFLKAERSDGLGQTFTSVRVNGGDEPKAPGTTEAILGVGIEANLDIQTVTGFTSPTPSLFYNVGGSPPFKPDSFTTSNTNEPYLEWLEYVIGLDDTQIPKVVSMSYGDDEQTVPLSYAKKVCNGFGQLGARGVSVIFASGDYGVGKSGKCKTNDKKNSSTFLAQFPASCPYVTSVGATENFHPEVAVSMDGPGGFSSGGGFSNYFTRPEWQRRDVDGYVNELGKTYQGLYNKTGRGFPDVSAQGAKYVIAFQGKFIRVSGTSAAAPTFASVISLLNDYSLSRGGRSLGFLNPWLYSQGRQGLNDVTSGSSSGCDTNGFAARKGWDPVTGLGTPNFKKLQSLLPDQALNGTHLGSLTT